MLAGESGRAPTSLSTEEAKLWRPSGGWTRGASRATNTPANTPNTPNTPRAQTRSRRRGAWRRRRCWRPWRRLDGELGSPRRSAPRAGKKTAKPPSRAGVRAGSDLSQKRPRSEQHDRSARYVLETEFPAGVKPRPRRPTREPNICPYGAGRRRIATPGRCSTRWPARRRRAPVTEPGASPRPSAFGTPRQEEDERGVRSAEREGGVRAEGDARQGQRRRHLGRARHGLFLTIGS